MSRVCDRCRETGRGKSGLHRAGCRITSGEGDLRESAAENNRLFLRGKGEKAV